MSAKSSLRLVAPSGRVITESQLFVPVQRSWRDESAAVTLTSPLEPLESGEWRIELEPAAPVDLQLRLTPAPTGATRSIDVRFLLARNCLTDVARARTTVEQLLHDSRNFLFALGLEVDQVHFAEADVEPCSLPRDERDLRQFATAERELVFIVTHSLEADDIGGFAPIGGTLGVAGSAFGVGGLSMQALEQPDLTPTIIFLHEIGHWAGLAHAVSAEGVEDALSDSPGCTPWVDADGDGRAGREECRDASFNFMFWNPRGLGGVDSQVQMIRRTLSK